MSLLRLFPLFLWTLFCVFMQIIFFSFGKNKFFVFYKIFFRGLVKIFGIKVNCNGLQEKENVFFVSNHVSYLDIFLLGSLIDGFFIAKSEIKKWPLINNIARLGKTIFVDREKRFKVRDQMNVISETLEKGFNVILFPEGTSSDGTRVLPFKSSLFGVINSSSKKNFFLQPISITYTKLDGIPIDKKFRPFLAWFGGMDLLPHAWKFLGLGLSEVNINFHKSRKFSSFSNRKDATNFSYKCISDQIKNNYSTIETDNKIKLYEFKCL